jgi:hypothetical protein
MAQFKRSIAMIAQRFRPVAWVIGCAVAATALYTVSLRVASERARLESIELKIASTRRDIRQLQTEMGTRASLRQLERWNGEELSLTTPQARQFLPSEQLLSRVDGASLPVDGFAPPPVMVTAAQREAEEKSKREAADPADAKGRVALLDEALAGPGKATPVASDVKAATPAATTASKDKKAAQ